MRGLPLFPWGCSHYFTALLCQSFSCLLSSRLQPSLLFVGVRRSSLRSLFFSLFRAPADSLFDNPLLLSSVTPWPAFLPPGLFFTLCAVRRSSRRLFCRPTSASGTFMSAGLRPPFLGLLVPDRPLPWPPCAWVASLAALRASFLAARHASSLAALWAPSLTARCAACLAARRAGSLAAQCAAYFATRRPACFAARCTACFAARCAACFAAQCDACFTARGVACLAAPCAASLAAMRSAFLDAPYVGSFPARPVASLAAQAGPPSASVVSRLRLPFRGSPFSAPFSAWSLPLTTSLHRFFHFSIFVPVSPSCGSLILGPSHV